MGYQVTMFWVEKGVMWWENNGLEINIYLLENSLV